MYSSYACMVSNLIFPFSLPHSRLLEINGRDVRSNTWREVGEFLHTCNGTVKMVVSRYLPAEENTSMDLPDYPNTSEDGQVGGSPNGMVIARFKRLSTSLSMQLDSQSAETDHWREECER